MLDSLRTILCVGGIGAALATSALAQPALTGETVLVNGAGPRAVGQGGATAAFGGDLFDLPSQPAALGEWRRFETGYAGEHERFPLSGARTWSAGVVVPLHRLQRALPSISVHHRRLRAATDVRFGSFGQTRRLELTYATESTAFAAGWSLGDDPRSDAGRGGAIGAALHVVESGGALTVTQIGSLGDTTRTFTPGLDDLLFAASFGAIGWWSRPAGESSALQLRAGAVWRRVGEESDALSATLGLTNLGGSALAALGFDPDSIQRPVMASEVAVGAGMRWRAPRATFTLQGEIGQPVHVAPRDDASWRWGAELRVLDAVSLRIGGVDDARLRDLVGGAGVEFALGRGWRAGLDLAFEPARFPEVHDDEAIVWSVRIGGPLPRGRERGADALDDLLDEIDDWLDGTAPDGRTENGGRR